MTRRELLRAFPAGAVTASAVRAQTRDGQTSIGYRDYPRCVPDYLRSLAAQALRRRDAEMGKLTTPARIKARQIWASETFWNLIGGRPERTPLNQRVTGSFQRARYQVESLVYESCPGTWISANLYTPLEGRPPYPGVLFQMGHSPNGKAADTYQRACQGLVQLGFVVLAFDPLGQGERTNYPRKDGLTRLGSADAEHTVPGRQMLLTGDTVTRLLVWDAIRSLDVLASSPQVDKTRLASAGQSGGGTLTMMLAAVDDRLAAAVVSSGNTENVACAHFRPPGSVDDAEQNFIGSGPLGFDRWDLLWPFAPKPLLILVSAKDSFGTYSASYEENGLEEYARLKNGYRLLGKAEHLQRVESALPHGLAYHLRLGMYRWLIRWFQPGVKPPDGEPNVEPEADRQLWATRSGSVIHDLGSRTPFVLSRARAAAIRTPAAVPDLREILHLSAQPASSRLHVLSRVPSRHGDILAAEVATAANVWAPLWLFLPKTSARRILIVIEPEGRNARWNENELYQELARDSIVCAPDLRCIGDLRPEFSGGSPPYAGEHQSEENYAWASLVLGASLLSQRVSDLLGVIGAVRDHFGNSVRCSLAARGALTVPALCAGGLESGISALYLARHLLSWRNIAETENYDHPLANFVPDVLRKTDLPAIAAAIVPRRIVLAGVVDAAGRTVPLTRVREVYAEPAIDIRKEEPWNAEALASL